MTTIRPSKEQVAEWKAKYRTALAVWETEWSRQAPCPLGDEADYIAEQAVAFALEASANRLKKLAEDSRHTPTRNAVLLCEDSIRSAIPTKGEGHE